LEWATHT